METRKVTDLKSHSLHAEIYNDKHDDKLLKSIENQGILTPLLITKEDVIISGNRRYKAAQELELHELPVIVSELTDDLDIREAIIESNKQRVKTQEQILREYGELKKIEKQRAKQRQGTRTDKGNILENCPGSQQGNARDIAAEKLQGCGIKMSGKTADKGLKVVEAIDGCEESGETDKANKLKVSLNKSIDSAFKEAKKEELIDDETIPAEIRGESQKTPIFNRTDKNKAWGVWSWNPVTGCRQGCDYCYARNIAKRYTNNFPKGFEPDFHEERLASPQNTRVPKEAETDIRYKTVFTCSLADLFGEWVDKEWIDKVLEAVRDAPQWNFLFFTKNPKRMAEFEFPDNAWVGATVDERFRIEDTEEAFRKINAKVKTLSCEPLLEDLTEGSTRDLTSFLKLFDWVIIGNRNSTGGLPDWQPEWEWVENLFMQARKAGCLVYFKTNLKVKPQEYPVCDNNYLETRLAKLKEKQSEKFDNIAEEWDQIESHQNGDNEYIRNYKLEQLLRPEEEELEKELKKKSNGKKNRAVKKKLKSNGNGSESDTGDKDEKDSTQESVQVTEN
jgi:protein gp37